MRPVGAIALLGAACALTGCGASPTAQVQAKLAQFGHAVAAREPDTLCRQVLAPALVVRLTDAGITCRAAMRIFVDGVTDPTISVSHVRVRDSQASAVVLTDARGQPETLTTVRLVRTGHGWRLASLASPR